MRLAEHHVPAVATWWIRLADNRYVSAFPEFRVAASEDLPSRAALLIGRPSEFEKLFEYGSAE